nr:MFS transporter [Halomarina rubra]
MLAHSMVHTYEFAFPVFVPIWLSQFGTTEAVIGVVLTLGLSLFGLGSLPAGVLADRYGSKELIVVCLVGMGGSFLLLGAAPAIAGLFGTESLPVIGVAPELGVVAVALVLWGTAASVYHPAGLSLITRGVEQRGDAFAYHGTAGNVGTALGPLLTTILLFALSNEWQLVAGILALPALAGALAATRVSVDETAAVAADGGSDGGSKADPGVDSLGEFLATSRHLFVGGFVVVFAVVMLSGLYYRGALTFLPELFGGFDAIQPVEFAGRELEPGNYIYTGLLAVGVAGQYAGGKLTDRIDVELGLAVGYGTLGVIALAYLPAAEAGLLPLLVLSALLGFFLFFVQPFYQATVAEYTPPEARGLSYGYTYLGVFGVGALGATVAGVALAEFSQPVLFTILAGFGLLAGLLGLGLYSRARGRSSPSSA